MSAILCLDLETSGLQAASAGIVEVGACLIEGGCIVESWSSLCWPGYAMLNSPGHWKALSISGINPALLLDAPPVEEALAAMAGWFSASAPFAVTSYNAAFDRGFIEAAAPWAAEHFDWSECLMHRARQYLGLPRSPRLGAACQALGVAHEERHRALGDALAAAGIAIELDRRGQDRWMR